MLCSRAVVEIMCFLHPFTGDLSQQHSHGLHVLHTAFLAGVFTCGCMKQDPHTN